MSVAWIDGTKGGHPTPLHKEQQMALAHPTPPLTRTEDAVSVLFCLTDEAYRLLNPRGSR